MGARVVVAATSEKTGSGLVFGCALSVVVILGLIAVVLVPTSSAAAVTATKLAPPYSGASTNSTHKSHLKACAPGDASLALNRTPAASPATGRFSVASFAYAGVCTVSQGFQSANVSTDSTMLIPRFQPTKSGNFSIVFGWRASWNVTAFVYRSHDRRGLATLISDASVEVNLFNNTSGTWAQGASAQDGPSALVFQLVTSQAVKDDTFSVTLNATLMAGDLYSFYASFATRVFAQTLTAYKDGIAWIAMNVGSDGNGAWLTSITVR